MSANPNKNPNKSLNKTPNKSQPINPYVRAYRNTEVKTANREALLLMMYAGAVRFLKQAIEAIQRKDIAEKVRLVGRTQEIVSELRATLNFEVGGEIATTLDALYGFITDRLLIGNRDTDEKALGEALKVLNTLQSAWEEAIANLKNG